MDFRLPVTRGARRFQIFHTFVVSKSENFMSLIRHYFTQKWRCLGVLQEPETFLHDLGKVSGEMCDKLKHVFNISMLDGVREARDHGLISIFCKRLSALVNRMVRLRNILLTEKYLRKIEIEREISQKCRNEMYRVLCM